MSNVARKGILHQHFWRNGDRSEFDFEPFCHAVEGIHQALDPALGLVAARHAMLRNDEAICPNPT